MFNSHEIVQEKAENELKNPGLSLVLKKFYSILEKEGVEKIDVKGKEFDPNYMECIEVVDNGKENQVIDEIRSGFLLLGNVLRTAQVRVGTGKEIN